jgi:hypothetical protein
MSQGKQVRGPSGGDTPVARDSEPGLAPGRRTLTMDLPSSQEPVVQRAVAEPSTRVANAPATPSLAEIVRPDLFAAPIQRQAAGPAESGAPPAPSGGGRPMDGGVRAHMEHAFGADFSAVRVHEGPQAPALGALAYTQGADIHFAPGAYAPDSQGGRQLLGHELAHVVQQAEGRVTATTQAKGVGINDDSALEREADDKGARAARGERVGGDAPVAVRGGGGGSVQRYAFVAGAQVTNGASGLTPEMDAMVKDEVVRSYTDTAEFKKHSTKSTDYLGNLKDSTWVRFSPTGINLVGENHTVVTLEQTVPAVNSTSFIYEPFASDDLSASPGMNAAYQKENAQRFKAFGVDGVADKKQFGAESLYPKIGYGMVLALPYFKGSSPLDDLKPAGYVGQPIQRYLKIAWGMSADAETQVAAQRAASKPVKPKYGAMADCHTAVKGQLDAFITALPIDGFLGDELTKPGKAALLPPLAKYAAAVSDAMIEMAAEDPSSRLDPAKRTDLKSKGAKDESEKESIFSDWRNFKFEDTVAAATAKGVRYAGMGQAHLEHLITKGLTPTQHPFKMADVDLAKFKTDTAALKAKAVKQ